MKRRKTTSPHSPGKASSLSQVNREIVDFLYYVMCTYWAWGEIGLLEKDQETLLSTGKLSELTCKVFSYFLFSGPGEMSEEASLVSLEFALRARWEVLLFSFKVPSPCLDSLPCSTPYTYFPCMCFFWLQRTLNPNFKRNL